MTALSLIVAAALGTALAHGLLLRHLPARWAFKSVPLILVFVVGLLFLIFHFSEWPVTPVIVVQVIVVSASVALCYALTIVGVVHDSPTLALVNTIESYGPDGMPKDEFALFIDKHPFVSSRIAALIEAGEIEEQDGGILRLSGHASTLLALGDAYQLLRGNRAEGTG